MMTERDCRRVLTDARNRVLWMEPTAVIEETRIEDGALCLHVRLYGVARWVVVAQDDSTPLHILAFALADGAVSALRAARDSS